MDHDWKTADNELDYCTVCGCYEGGTTTECPGASVSFETGQRVYRGEIDFRNGEWCNQPAIGMSHVYGTSREPYRKVEICDTKSAASSGTGASTTPGRTGEQTDAATSNGVKDTGHPASGVEAASLSATPKD